LRYITTVKTLSCCSSCDLSAKAIVEMGCFRRVWRLFVDLPMHPSLEDQRNAVLPKRQLKDIDVAPSAMPMPRVPHRTLEKQDCRDPDGRVVVVGDVNGCIDELQELLSLVEFKENEDTLVFVGNLVNRGPASGEVIRLARKCGAISVRGVDDDSFLRAVHGKRDGNEEEARDEVHPEDLQWLQECPMTLSIPWLKLMVVHGSLDTTIPRPRREDGELLNLLVGGRESWLKRLQDGLPDSRAMGLDTGCCRGRALTAMVFDSHDANKQDFFSVFSKAAYA